MRKKRRIYILRIIATIALVVGALVSLGFVLYAGRNNNSILLRILFAIWVFSPYMALLFINIFDRHWTVITRIVLYWLMIFIALFSVISYGEVITIHGIRPAFAFLVVPLSSLVIIAIIIPLAEFYAKKMMQQRRKNRNTRNV